MDKKVNINSSMNKHQITTKLVALLVISFPFIVKAQLNMVQEIVAADYYASELAANKGVLAGLKSGVDDNTIFFKPAPQEALGYLNNRPNIPDVISWKPVIAKIAKSNEWGFTTGPISSSVSGMKKNYGSYLTVWKRNHKGKWKVGYRAQIKHARGVNEQAIEFVNPENQKFIRQRSEKRLEQRKDIISSTDQLMGTILKADNRVGYDEFLSDDARLLFSGFTPVSGKEEIQQFLIKNKIDIKTTVVDVDRSLSGELAFSYGDAKVIKDNLVQNFYYLRIWELNEEYKWNVLIEMLFEK